MEDKTPVLLLLSAGLQPPGSKQGPRTTARALLRDFHPGLQLCGREEGAWPSREAMHQSHVQEMGGQREPEARPFLGGQEPGGLGFCPGAEFPSPPVLPGPQSSHL